VEVVEAELHTFLITAPKRDSWLQSYWGNFLPVTTL